MLKFNEPYLSGKEFELINDVLSNSKFCGNGKYSLACEKRLEEKYGFKNCFLTPSCTAGIEMASLILDLNSTDEIIIPSYTFASCPNPFLIKGNKVVLADCEENYPNISLEQIKKLVTPNTKAVMAMHYGGVACDIQNIQAFCKEHNLYLIEDAAQCINAYHNNIPLGSFGDVSVFSFHETKNVHCGEGGAIVINNPNLMEKAEVVRQYGTDRTKFLKGEVEHYKSVGLGLALFQSELNAAFLYAQLQAIDEVTTKRKTLWMDYYNGLLEISGGNFSLVNLDIIKGFNGHNFFIKLIHSDIDNFISYMNDKEIQAVKHFYPLHLSELHKSEIKLPIATSFNNKLVRFPLHVSMSKNDIDKVVNCVANYFSK